MRLRSTGSVGLLFLLGAGISTAQQAPPPTPADSLGWKFKSKAGLALTQSSFSRSWAGDEVGTVSWVGTWDSEAHKRLAPWALWDNSLQLQFGQTHQQTKDRERWLKPAKSADKIAYRGIVRFQYGGYVDPYAALDVDSQFFSRNEALHSPVRTFTPTRISESAGIARALLKNERRTLVTRLGFAVRENIDRLDYDAATQEFRTATTSDGGVEWFTQSRVAGEKDRSVLKSELRVFKAVTTSESNPGKRLYWPAVDVDWQSTWSNKVTSFLSFDLFWQLRYDKQVDLRGQFKQTTGFGLVWQLI
jgi:hypothetical protein